MALENRVAAPLEVYKKVLELCEKYIERQRSVLEAGTVSADDLYKTIGRIQAARQVQSLVKDKFRPQ